MTLHEEILEEVDAMVRDFTSVSLRPKSEVRRRILSSLKRYGEAMVEEIPEDYDIFTNNLRDSLRSKFIQPLDQKK